MTSSNCDEYGDDGSRFTGDLYGAPFVDGLPLTATNQRCSCDARPTWVHRINAHDRQFHVKTKAFTLPSFVTLCDECEELRRRSDTHALLHRRAPAGNDYGDWERQIAEASTNRLVSANVEDTRRLRPE